MIGTNRFLQTVGIAILATATASPAAAQGPRGFGGGQELELVDRFDADGNGRLNLEERNAARSSLGSGQGGRGGFGFGFGGGGATAQSSPGINLSPEDVQFFDDESLYDESALRTIFLQFENDDWEAELAAFKDSDVEVPALVSVDGRDYPDVGVHFRGASSFMMVSEGSKRSLNLSFNFVDSDQRLLGYRTVNLLNAASDPTFLRAVFYSHIAQEFLPVPKMNFVRVVINGENWGVYANAQQFNTDFASDWFGTSSGARWKVPGNPRGRAGMEYLGEDIDAYRGLYDIRSRDRDESWEDLIEMFRVLNETPLAQLQTELEPLLDVDGVLRFLALEVALVNGDGYWTRASDYSIYQDEQGRFHVIPHDVNEAMMAEGGGGGPGGFGGGRGGFGGGGRFDGGGGGFGGGGGPELDPLTGINDSTKPLRSRLLAVPELQERYLGYVSEIAETWLDWEEISPLLEGYRELIRADVERDTRKLYTTAAFDEGFDGESGSLKSFIEARQAYLLEVPAD